jgi:hypothetical protein
MRKRKASLFSIFLFLGYSAASASPGLFQEAKISRDGEVEVVRNGKKPAAVPGRAARPVLTEDLIIGRDPGELDYVFGAVRSVQVDDDGDIIVLDWEDNLIKVFDAAGRFIRSFGRHGQGPGEIQSPSRMYLQGGRAIAIMDTGNSRYSLYDKTGLCLKEFNLGRYRVFRTVPDSRGYVYGDQLKFDPKPATELIRIEPDFSDARKLAEYEYDISQGTVGVIFDRLTFGVFPDDRFFWARNSKYEIHVLDPKGREIRRILKDYNPVRITDKDKDELLKQYQGAEKDNIPGEYQPFFYLLGDDEGRLYARTYERDERDRLIYDVFDPEGRFFARMALPEWEMLFVVKRGKAYVMITEDPEDGSPLVKRYTLEWR